MLGASSPPRIGDTRLTVTRKADSDRLYRMATKSTWTTPFALFERRNAVAVTEKGVEPATCLSPKTEEPFRV